MYAQELVDKYYPGVALYEAMEVWSLPKNKKDKMEEVSNSGDYFAQIKKDGNWYSFNKSIDGTCYLFSRGTKTGLPVECIDKVPHIKAALDALPNDTVVIGEIYYPGQTTNEVRTIMGCAAPKAVARQKEKGNIHFYLHDILRMNGQEFVNVGAYDRYTILKTATEYYNILTDEIELAEIIEEDIYAFGCAALAKGEEGTVLKLKTAPYAEGKRPAWSMIKFKEVDTADVVCIGFEDATMNYEGTEEETWPYWIVQKDINFPNGQYVFEERCEVGKPHHIRGINFRTIPVTKGYYYGWKTSIRIGVYKDEKLIEIGTVSSGLNDELRADFARNPEKYLNRVIECECMRKTESALRHPRFMRFRDDKKPTSCTFESVFN
jgi:ATP-dependent DNA ligase